MADITFISGGCRSGKSSYAEQETLNQSKPHYYLATAEAFDDEMKDRIARHQELREGRSWISFEEPLEPEKVFKDLKSGTVLLDCLTLWISKLMWEAEKRDEILSEKWMAERVESLIKAMHESPCDFVVVSNETGLGIMPINAQARLFGDLAGRTNQLFAKSAKKVVFMVSGLPMVLKDD